MTYLDVYTPVVVTAGHQTAHTAQEWSAWASNARTAFDNAKGAAHNGTVTVALEGYAGDVNTKASAVSSNVDALGVNTVAAANTVHNADGDGARHLTLHGSMVQQGNSHLTRPIYA